ncbi:MAG: DnaD domain protein [Chloroflexi bacterium]|nr:DnaD domain protein [Chloroflexota bacterium]
MEPNKGFPPGARYIPAPSLLFSSLLEEIGSLDELKCVLRVIGLVHQHKGQRLWLSGEELVADPVLLNGLAGEEGGPKVAILRGLNQAQERGVLLQAQSATGETLYFLNDSPGRKAHASAKLTGLAVATETASAPDGEASQPRPNIFTLYEENIGLLTPILAQELEEAERTYPPAWIAQAFREAAADYRRNWRYIQRILEGWASQGRGRERSEGTDYGEPWRHPEETDRKEYLRKYEHLAPWADKPGPRS